MTRTRVLALLVLLLLAIPARAQSPTLRDGLLGYWAFDGDARDAIAGRDLVLGGSPAYTSGRQGTALTTASTASATAPQTFPGVSAATLAFWTPGGKTGSVALFGDGDEVLMAVIDATQIVCAVMDVDSNTWQTQQARCNEPWCFYVCSFDSASVRLSRNGAAPSVASAAPLPFPGPNVVAVNLSSTAMRTLDELALWNRVLSDAEIAALYNQGAGLPLVDFAYYPAPEPLAGPVGVSTLYTQAAQVMQAGAAPLGLAIGATIAFWAVEFIIRQIQRRVEESS